MPKFSDVIGYGETEEISPGVWQDVIVERRLFGDVVRSSRRLQESSEKLNDDITVNVAISVVADAYASNHIFAIRYVKWAGARWKVTHVDVQFPRLTLTLGGLYNGPTP